MRILVGALVLAFSLDSFAQGPPGDAGIGSYADASYGSAVDTTPGGPPVDDESGDDVGSAAQPATAPASGSAAPSRFLPQLTAKAANEIIEIHATLQTPNSNIDPDPLAASDSVVDQPQLSLRPHRRAEDLTQEVPGLFTVQHAGGGKAQQYFMRGFDLDHGTDLAGFVDGVPINAVSHGHGQGYLDLHFLIPETIASIDATKGPYSPLVGDFATAGSMTFHVADHVDESIAKVEAGQDGHRRAVVVESPDLGPNWRMLVAAEAFDENGPFIHPEDYDRLSGVAKATRKFDDGSELTFEGMSYSGTWNMSGVLPARAVCGESDGTPVPAAYAGTHCISRWDSIDPSQGGDSGRYMLETTFRKPIPRGYFEASLYGLHSNFQLFPNDGIAASFQPEGVRYGSQVEQDDARFEQGMNVRVRQEFRPLDRPLESTFGLQIRNDSVASQLHRTEDRMRLDGLPGIPGPIEDSAIDITETGPYVQEDYRPLKWLRVMLGAREDRIDGDVNNESPTAVLKPSGYRGATQFSPKAALVVSPDSHVDLFANFGQGFHSNDIRTVIIGSATTLIARATGGEVGATVKPITGLQLSALAFLLDLTSEETIDGDTASTDPSGPTRRYGTEATARYQYKNIVYAEAAYTYAHARYTDAADIAAGTIFVPLAPVHTFSAEVGAIYPVAPKTTVIGSLNVRAMSDRPAEVDNSLTATGFTVFNGLVGVRYDRYEASLSCINIANALYREGQFAVSSRLPGESANPAEGISFTPGVPREFLASLSIRWR
ncbi:MAG TPA: TonB-dependent receptor [Kofleriaceae bacterium]|jgi:outer membrane receptor protein involved in Fe transport